MLKQRIITAAILLLLLGGSLAGPWRWPFLVLVAVFLSLGAWEWARLCGLAESSSRWVGMGFAVFCTTALLETPWGQWLNFPKSTFWLIYIVVWLWFAGVTLQRGVQRWRQSVWHLCAGLVVLAMAWLSVLQVLSQGIYFLISLLALVWVADTGAYMAGKVFGQKWIKRKLAPTISPGKSWEGVLGGMCGVLILATVFLWIDTYFYSDWGRSFYGVLFQHWGVVGLVPVCLLLCVMSVMGDLLESLAKRSAGLKDSSQILPGHGGVLDRIDGLLPVLPFGALVVAHFS